MASPTNTAPRDQAGTTSPANDRENDIATYMLVAMGLLAFLGLRYPVKLLPILLFESAWKLIWLTAVALPLWTAERMDSATLKVASACLWVVIVLAVIPWRYVVAHYVTKPGDPWRVQHLH